MRWMSNSASTKLPKHGIPTALHPVATLIRTYGDHRSLPDGQLLHAHILMAGLGDNTRQMCFLENLLIQMYGKCGGLKEAKLAFGRIRKRSLITWNAMIGAFSQHGYIEDVMGILKEMQVGSFTGNEERVDGFHYYHYFSIEPFYRVNS